MKLELFATPNFPLRASHLEKFLSCNWREVLLVFGAVDSSGEAADIGSAVHAAIDTWHKTEQNAAAAVEAMRTRLNEYPKADLPQAAALFLAYAADPSNISADIVLGETEVTFEISPSPEDPTGTPITIVGHTDQVRREVGVLKVWDVKTSKKMPHEVLWSTCVQGAAYCAGATKLLGETVHPGGIIMPRRSPMHIPFTWTVNDIDRILDPIRHHVALVRKGIVSHVPEADRCKWCHTGGPDVCLPQLRYHLPMVKT